MTIKRNDEKSISIESLKITSYIDLGNKLSVHFSEGEIIFSKPGEYEFKGVDLIVKEQTEESYTGTPNLLKLSVEGVRVLYLIKFFDHKQEEISQILDIDILLIDEVMLDKLDRLVMLYDPKKIIVIQNKLSVDEISEKIKKINSTSQIELEKSIKVKSEDFSSEHFIISFSILK